MTADKFDVILANMGSNKVKVLQVVLHLTHLGLARSKELVDNAPSTILRAVSLQEAEQAALDLKSAGASAEVRPTK